jgi:hypothetical protein
LNRFYVDNEKMPDLDQYFQVQPNVFDDFTPASSLLERAEQAEQSLRQAHAQAAATADETAETARQTSEALRQTSHALCQTGEALRQSGTALAELSGQAAEAHHQNAVLSRQINEIRSVSAATEQQLRLRAGELEVRLTEAQHQYATLARQCDEIRLVSVGTEQQLQQILISHGQMQRHAEAAEAYIKAIWSSTSWRMTAPYRYVGRLARKVFHGCLRQLLAMPGMRHSVRLVYRLAPRPVEWLSVRYCAYERQPPILADVPVLSDMPETPAVVIASTATLELSDDEARVLRQLLTTCHATTRPARFSKGPVPSGLIS